MRIKSLKCIVKELTTTIKQLDALIAFNEVMENDNKDVIEILLLANGDLRNVTLEAATLKANLNKLLGVN